MALVSERQKTGAPAEASQAALGKWLVFTLATFVVFLAVAAAMPRIYRTLEPSFLNPVAASGEPWIIRNDEMGEGHFGASRSRNRLHDGIDIEAPLDYPVRSAKSGRVSYAAKKGGYGNFVRVEHLDGLNTRYAHLSRTMVKKGSWIRQGDVVGRVGKTGNADSSDITPHLHFEIRHRGDSLDPTALLMPFEPEGPPGTKSPQEKGLP